MSEHLSKEQSKHCETCKRYRPTAYRKIVPTSVDPRGYKLEVLTDVCPCLLKKIERELVGRQAGEKWF